MKRNGEKVWRRSTETSTATYNCTATRGCTTTTTVKVAHQTKVNFWFYFNKIESESKYFFYQSSLLYFVFDPSESLYYYWLIIVSLAVLYNYLFIIGRASFELLQDYNPLLWIVLDYICDVIYLIDMFVRLRTGKNLFFSLFFFLLLFDRNWSLRKSTSSLFLL